MDERIWDSSRWVWQETRQSPPRWHELSARQQAAFSRCGRVRIETSMFVDDSNRGNGTNYGYPRSEIDLMIAHATRRPDAVVRALSRHVSRGDRVVVIGSQSPRYEAAIVAMGATTLTVDYNKLNFDHPSMQTQTAREFFSSEGHVFDVLLTASSLDHDGLGRYSDPIAPDGDLMTMDMLKRRARLHMLTIPVGPDTVAFNLMRIYGPIRLPLLIQGFELVAAYDYSPARLNRTVANFRVTYEPVFVLRPSDDPLHRPLDHWQNPSGPPEASAAAPPSSSSPGGNAELR